MLQFGQKSVDSKDFYRSKRIIDVSNIDLDKIVVSNSISCNKGKDQRFVVGYEDDEKIIALYIKTPPKVFSYGVSQYSENSAWNMGFNVEDHEDWQDDYNKIWKAVEEQLFITCTGDPIKEGRYLNAKVKVWKDKIRTNFHGNKIPYNQHCEATAVLKISSVYKQGNNYYPQVYVEEAKIKPVENSKCILLSDSENDYE